jgi:hypothetical protein
MAIFVVGKTGASIKALEPTALGLCVLSENRQITPIADKASREPAIPMKTLTGFEVQRGLLSGTFFSIFTSRLPRLFIEVPQKYTTGCGDQPHLAQYLADWASVELENDY